MSAVLATAEPRRIKASHRRRRKVTAGRFVQRYYDPQLGRFLSVDPMMSDMNNGWNFNRYNYAANSPYKFTDPDGRCIWDGCVVEAIAVGMIIGAAADVISQTFSDPNKPIDGRSVAISAVVGGATAVVPGAAALRMATIPAKIAVGAGTAGAIGAAGSAAKQQITTGKIDGGQVAIDAAANGVGQVVGGTIGAAAGRTLATTTVPAVRGLPVTSLSGRVFQIGAQPAQTTVTPLVKSVVAETVGNAGQATTGAALSEARKRIDE